METVIAELEALQDAAAGHDRSKCARVGSFEVIQPRDRAFWISGNVASTSSSSSRGRSVAAGGSTPLPP